MFVQLTKDQINSIYEKATRETCREIYEIKFNGEEIYINGDWSITRNEKTPINVDIKNAITEYCSQSNIEWEYDSQYRSWAD